MPRIIAKFGYMKPSNVKRSSFLEYIATRDGVLKNIEKITDKPPTTKQLDLIKKLVNKYPKIMDYESYKTFEENKSVASASEFITEVEESHYRSLNRSKEYIEYIAKRPRVVKEGTHGLFTNTDEKIVLEQLKKRIEKHQGNIWTGIISLKREDAHRLGYEDLKSWKILVRSLQNELSKNIKIDPVNFEWYAAFHNEAHHPHIHLIMFSKDEKQGYLNKKSIDNIRSAFAKEIFKQDLLHIYKSQTHYRDQLKLSSETYIKSKVSKISKSFKYEEIIDLKLIELSKILRDTPGKHTYGYLPKNTKAIVDEIVNLLSHNPVVRELLDLWYLQRQEILYTYTDKKEKIKNLADIDAFRSVKNIIIKHADNIITPTKTTQEQINTNIKEVTPISINHKTNTLVPQDAIYQLEKLFEKEYLGVDEGTALTSKSETILNQEKGKEVRNIVHYSLNLFYSISNMFESSMISQAQKYHADQELLKNIKKQKIALGHRHDDK
ncbi:MobP3 family relaxase [Erysipelothrix rhusiopathiae]|nr:MobP3 family relaxase [Erysipelothrix rhusiopathiae]